MLVRYIKVVDAVVVLSPVIEHVRARTSAQTKIETSLCPLASRLQPHLHDAFGNRYAIAKFRYMPHCIIHPSYPFVEKRASFAVPPHGGSRSIIGASGNSSRETN